MAGWCRFSTATFSPTQSSGLFEKMSALVSSLLTEVNQSEFDSQQEKENARGKVISRLLVTDWNDSAQHIVSLLFTMIGHSGASEKLQGWRLLPILLRSQNRRHSYVAKPLCQFIDKQALAQHIRDAPQSSTVMLEAISSGVNSILALSLDVGEVSSSIDSQLTKLISCLMESLRAHSSTPASLFALQVMTMLVTAKGRLFTPQQLNRVISCSFQLLPYAHLYSSAATLLAVCASAGSSDLFESMWKSLSNECTRLLQVLGLGVAGESHSLVTEKQKPEREEPFLGFRFEEDAGNLVGIQKAIYIEGCYRGLCAALSQMALLGNASGAIAQDFRGDVAISLNIAICHRAAVGSKEAKFTLENRASISPAHVSVVWPQLTLHALSLLKVLLLSVGPSPLLFPFAATACSCVSSALTHVLPSIKKVTVHSDTAIFGAIQALDCFKCILRSFPTIVISKCEQILLKFVDVVSLQVLFLTTDPQQQVDNASEVNGSIFNTNKDLLIASFEACETLLMSTSVLLPVAVRQQLEIAVSRGLKCLSKGVVLNSFLTLDQGGGHSCTPQRLLKHVQQNKKVRREVCEAIRSDVDIQNSFLQLASAEVQTTYADGSRSANVPLLSNAAAVCASHEVTASVCGRIGLTVGNILFPAGVGLPSPPLVETAHRKIAEHNAFIEQVDSVEESAAVECPEEGKKRKEVDRSTSVVDGEDDQDDSGRVEPPSKAPKVDWSLGSSKDITGGSKGNNSTLSTLPTVTAGPTDSSDDEDDELPDIDIEADIDA